MEEIEILKVKIVKIKDGETLEFDFLKPNATGKKTPAWENPASIIHPDLKEALQALAIHLVLLTDQVEMKEIKDIKNIPEKFTEKIHIHGYSMGGDDEDPGIVITGHRILHTGKALILNTPFTRINEDEKTGYKFMPDLCERLTAIENEVIKYRNGDKVKPDPQLDMFNKDEKVTNMKVVPPSPEAIVKQIVDDNNAGKLTNAGVKLPKADPEAMKRILADDKPAGKKRVPQTAKNKSGIADE